MNASAAHRLCLGCGESLPAPFLNLGCTPLANSYVRPEDDGPEPAYPLSVAHCDRCHLVQLTDTAAPEKLFSEYLYFSSYSSSYLEHARAMAESLAGRFNLGPHSRVIEIASNDGYLLQYFRERNIRVLGIEPAGNIAAAAEARGIPTWCEFFGPSLTGRLLRDHGAADLIIGNNVLAHVPGVNGFLRAVRDCLAPEGYAVFEFPYLADLLSHVEFDTIYHEHVFYYSLTAIHALAQRAGLYLCSVERQEVHGGSLRVFLSRAAAEPDGGCRVMFDRERASGLLGPEPYLAFARRVEETRKKLTSLVGELRAGRNRVAAYGAPAKGNTLLNHCRLGSDDIEFTVDRSPHKQGLLLPGSRIPILPVAELAARRPEYTLILPWNLTPEIIRQEQEYVRGGGRFIVPIPEPSIIAREQAAAAD